MPGLDSVESLGELVHLEQRLVQPAAQQPAAHGSARGIEHAKQRSLLVGAADRLRQFEVAAGSLIEGHELVGAVDTQAHQLRQRRALRFPQILHQRAGGAHSLRQMVAPESRQRLDLELLQQRLPRGLFLEPPRRNRDTAIPVNSRSAPSTQPAIFQPSCRLIAPCHLRPVPWRLANHSALCVQHPAPASATSTSAGCSRANSSCNSRSASGPASSVAANSPVVMSAKARPIDRVECSGPDAD